MNIQILVFRTSVSKKTDIKRVKRVFKQHPQILSWNIDFEDWEKVLRIESSDISASKVIELLRFIDIYAQELT